MIFQHSPETRSLGGSQSNDRLSRDDGRTAARSPRFSCNGLCINGILYLRTACQISVRPPPQEGTLIPRVGSSEEASRHGQGLHLLGQLERFP